MRRTLIAIAALAVAVTGLSAGIALAGGDHQTTTTTCGPAADQYGCTTTTQTTTTQTTTTSTPPSTPCPITPSNPTGSLPPHPGGQDGQPGNDICKEDEPPPTEPPVTTTPPPTQPPATETTPLPEPPVTTDEDEVTEEPAEPTPDAAPPVRVHSTICKAPAYMLKGECVRDFKGTPHAIALGSG